MDWNPDVFLGRRKKEGVEREDERTGRWQQVLVGLAGRRSLGSVVDRMHLSFVRRWELGRGGSGPKVTLAPDLGIWGSWRWRRVRYAPLFPLVGQVAGGVYGPRR